MFFSDVVTDYLISLGWLPLTNPFTVKVIDRPETEDLAIDEWLVDADAYPRPSPEQIAQWIVEAHGNISAEDAALNAGIELGPLDRRLFSSRRSKAFSNSWLHTVDIIGFNGTDRGIEVYAPSKLVGIRFNWSRRYKVASGQLQILHRPIDRDLSKAYDVLDIVEFDEVHHIYTELNLDVGEGTLYLRWGKLAGDRINFGRGAITLREVMEEA